MNGITTEIEPGLVRLKRPNGVIIWIATANQITLMSYSERYARKWLAQERDQGPDAA